MGMRTVVVINNDDWHEIRERPEQFVESIYHAMHEPGVTRAGNWAYVTQAENTYYSTTWRVEHLAPERVKETP